MPFAWAVRMLDHVLGVQVSEETVRRLAEQAGASIEAVQTAQAKAPMQEEPQGKTGPARLAESRGWSMCSLTPWGVGRSAHGGHWRGGRTLHA